MANSSNENQGSIWLSIAVLLGFLAAWEWGPMLFEIPPYIIPSASSVFFEFVHSIDNERLFYHTGVTLLSTIVGFTVGSLLGMVIGYVLGVSPKAEFILSPYILALQIAPKVAFAPLFVVWFGFTVYPKILVAVLIVFFPIMVNVLSAIRTVDPDMINLARTFNATRWQIFKMIEFRDAMPPLFSGLRIGSTLAIIGVAVGEMVGGSEGLGAVLVGGGGSGNTALVFVAIVMMTLVGILAYIGVVFLEKRVLHYMPRNEFNQI
ncbi:MAG: ABC transporter permease [Rhodospirillaceae bacterium]|jgi:NitT/TauT family transport system permease protein|nr:ABC transporter permease [Rhodospirillaceae bacterium]MBT4938368.1 ABC transporter permease [Rhodospirillaceae bacterium]MBT7266375.1 ABC transporter permease [Rhodospirillaceae bacterium]